MSVKNNNQTLFSGRRHIQGQNNRFTQVDRLISVETQLQKPLNKNINFNLKLLWGQFSSNKDNVDTNFYQVSSALNWVFE